MKLLFHGTMLIEWWSCCIILCNRKPHCWFFNLCRASQTARCVDSRTSIRSTVHYAVPVPTFLNRNWKKKFTEQKQSAVKMELNTSINALWKIRRGEKRGSFRAQNDSLMPSLLFIDNRAPKTQMLPQQWQNARNGARKQDKFHIFPHIQFKSEN